MPRAIALPAVAPATAPVLDLIAVRRSVRRFAATPMALPALSAVLRTMSGGGAARLSNAVRINLVVHHVAGLASGAYRYEMTSHTLAPRGPSRALRTAARSAALDQDVIGDAAAVFVLSVDRATIAADAAGAPRGYRHALLEAGMVGERIYLEGGARGLGVCAVGAFFDEEAAALVGVDPAQEWVVHFAAIGVPAA
jgi:SagB-type dehydrogenase family enzyme